MASVDPHETLTVKSDEPLSQEAMQMQQAQFSKEAFIGLLEFYKIRPKSAKWIHESKYQFATSNVNETIIVLSYVFRPLFRNMFNQMTLPKDRQTIPREISITAFEKIIMAFSVSHEDYYFLLFLAWIAYVIEFTIVCYVNGKDYIEFAVQCLSKYSDTQYFHSQGGWQKLHKICKPFSDVFDVLFTVLLSEQPQSKDVYPFFYSVNKSIKEKDVDRWFWCSVRGRFILKKYEELMKLYNLDLNLSVLTDRSESRQKNFPNSIPQTPLLSPLQAFSETSSWKCSENISPQSNSTPSSPVRSSPKSVMSERSFEVCEKQFVDSMKALRINEVDTVIKFSKCLENMLTSAAAETLNLAMGNESVSSSEICFEIDEELPIFTRELCECLIKVRLGREINTGVSWSKLSAEASDQIKCSESKSGVQANVAGSSGSADACSSVGASQIQNRARIPNKLSSLQLDSDNQDSDVQTSNEHARNVQKQSKSQKKKRSRKSKNKRKK